MRDRYINALAVAVELGARSVAFPLISSGVYRWPVEDAVTQALTAMQGSPHRVDTARLVVFDAATRAVADRVRQRLQR